MWNESQMKRKGDPKHDEDLINKRWVERQLDLNKRWVERQLDLNNNTIINSILDYTKGIGAIYESTNSTSPATLYGGTWVQLKDRFLIGAGGSYSAGATGGAATHAHTSATHTHGFDLWACIGSPNSNASGIGFSAINWNGRNSTYSVGNAASSATNGPPTRSHDTKVDGSISSTTPRNTGSASSIPPYRAVYMWYRSA